jgi:hypothetical protein
VISAAKSDTVLIPRIPLISWDTNLPFSFIRKQFPYDWLSQ